MVDRPGSITLYAGATAALATTFANGAAFGVPSTRMLSRADSKFTPTVNVQYKRSGSGR